MAQLRRQKSSPDWWLLLAVLLLIAIGIIMVFSSSQYFAQYDHGDTYYYLKAQLLNAGVGLVLMAIAYKMNVYLYRKLSYTAYLIELGLLVFLAAAIQFGTAEEAGGASRWLELFGMNFQPSELAKIALPMALAKWLSGHLALVKDLKRGFLPCMALIALTALLIYAQNSLSVAFVVAAAACVMLFCAGCRVSHFGILLGIGAAGVTGAIALQPWRLERIYAWLDPWAYAQGDGWQTTQSLMAIGSGGLTGVGLGSGGSKWYYLPERHTDFIFSVLCEEMGFIGALFVLLLIVFILWRGIMIAVKAPNTYTSLLAIGLVSSLAIQSMLNLGVCTGLLPVTGVTLPFVSYGGTSLVVSMTMIGILLNISRHIDT